MFDGVYLPPSRLVLLRLNSARLDYGSHALVATLLTDLPHFSQCLANIYCKLSTYLNYQIKTLFMMWGRCPTADKRRCWVYIHKVCACTDHVSFSTRVCPIQTQLWHSVHAVHPRRPPPLMCARWPHTSMSSPPCPLSQSRPTATPPHAPMVNPVDDNPPLPPTARHVMRVSQG